MNILIIDDSVADATLLGHALLSHIKTANVEAVTTGQVGLAKINQATFDLVFLDLNLSQEHGWDILQQIRMTPNTSRLKVVMTSTEASEEFVLESIRLGANAFLAKVLDFSQFQREVGRIYEQLAKGKQPLRLAA